MPNPLGSAQGRADWQDLQRKLTRIVKAGHGDAVKEAMLKQLGHEHDPNESPERGFSRNVQRMVVDHPEYLHYAADLGMLADAEYRRMNGWAAGPYSPNQVPITVQSAPGEVLTRFMAVASTTSGIVAQLTRATLGRDFDQEAALQSMTEVLFDMLAGRRPIVFLTAGQQEALWHTHAEPETIHGSVWPHGPIVILPHPIDFRAVSIVGLVFRSERAAAGQQGDVDLLVDWRTQIVDDGDRITWLRAWIPHVAFRVQDADDEAWSALASDDELRRLRDFIRSVWVALEMFGMAEEPIVANTPSRAERRRAERDAKKGRVSPSASQVSVRYLRDPRGKVAARRVTEHTGKHLKPHWRKGHIRYVRSGSMSIPKEQRPTVRHLIPPVIVNQHLGDPHGAVVYRCQDSD